MKQTQLFPLVRRQVAQLLNGYLKTKELKDLDNYIVPNSLQDRQGSWGFGAGEKSLLMKPGIEGYFNGELYCISITLTTYR